MSKIQTLAFEEGVIDVLSKKVKIIRVRQVEPSIEYLESGKRKRLFKAVERHFPKLNDGFHLFCDETCSHNSNHMMQSH